MSNITMPRLALALFLLIASAFAQFGSHDVLYVVSAPSGACIPGSRLQVVINAGTLYSCQSSTWAQITGGGGSSGTINNANQYSFPYYSASGSANTLSGVAPPTANGLYNLVYNVTGAAAVAPTASLVGLSGRTISGSSSTDTILYSDNLTVVNHDRAGSAAVTETLPTATTLGNAAFAFSYENDSTESDTVTPTTWTINGNASLTVAANSACRVKINPNLATDWLAFCGGTGGTTPTTSGIADYSASLPGWNPSYSDAGWGSNYIPNGIPVPGARQNIPTIPSDQFLSSAISNVAEASGTVTLTVASGNFAPGTVITFWGLTVATQLNGGTYSMASGTTNTSLVFADRANRTISSQAETGTAVETGVVSILNNSSFDDDGWTGMFANGTYVEVYQTNSTGGTSLSAAMRASTDQGHTWSAQTLLLTGTGTGGGQTNYYCCGGGITPSGRMIVQYTLVSAGTRAGIWSMYSDNLGTTFSTPVELNSLSSVTIYGAPLIAIGNGDLMTNYYGTDGSGNIATFVQISTDNGVTWGSPIEVVSSATLDYNEAAYVYLGGQNILGMVRCDTNTAPCNEEMNQFLSTNNGTSWTNQGAIAFSGQGEGTNAALSSFWSANGTRMVELDYMHRQLGEQLAIYGYASDLITAGPTAWQSNNTVVIGTATFGTNSSSTNGYASAFHPYEAPAGFGRFYQCGNSGCTTTQTVFFSVAPGRQYAGDLLVNGRIGIGPSAFSSPYSYTQVPPSGYTLDNSTGGINATTGSTGRGGYFWNGLPLIQTGPFSTGTSPNTLLIGVNDPTLTPALYPSAQSGTVAVGLRSCLGATNNGAINPQGDTCLGASAMANGGTNSVAIGNNAIQAVTGAITGNTAVGYFAGRYISGGSTSNTGGTLSTLIGYNAFPLAASDTDEIVIGQSAVGSGSHTATVGTSTTTLNQFYGAINTATYQTTTKCAATGTAASPSVASCSAAPAGSFSCATNASGATCVVDTSAITANSAVFVQPSAAAGTLLSVTCNTTADSGLIAPRLASISAATSFTINLGTFSTNPLCFNYWIVN